MARYLPLRPVGVALLALALAGCGERTDLRPRAGKTLPTAPYGRVDKPSSPELLVQTSTARPVLSIELHQRSEERVDDPFDLPPKE